MGPSDYQHVVLGLIFLKYVSGLKNAFPDVRGFSSRNLKYMA